MTPRFSEWRRLFRVFTARPGVTVGCIILLLFVLIAVFARWLSPYDPNQIDLINIMLTPGSEGHLLGTDLLGRDILSRLIYGARVALFVSFVTTLLSAAIGITFGTIAGYFGGWVNTIIMRITDALIAFPRVLLALVIAAVLGGGIRNLIIALCIGGIAHYMRMTNGVTLSIKENDYVLAGRVMGAGNLRQMATHIFPNALAPLIVQMTLQLGFMIMAEAGLSFLGVGVLPPTAAWGSMVFEGYSHLHSNPILSLAPGMAIILVVFACNMVGDGLRDALDPKLRGKI
jgi:ABC-type dipeptide/oligopeptide/nickel transport system permease subunit